MRFLYSALCLIGIAVVQCVIISNSRFADSLPWSGYSESLPHPASSGDRPYSASHTQSIKTKHHQHESLTHSSRHLHSTSKSHSSKHNSKYDENNDDGEYRKQEKKQKKKSKQEQKQKKHKQQKQKHVADEAQAAEQPLPPRPRKPFYQPYELPNKRLSRGAVFLNATSNVVCTPGYIHQIANLTDAQQKEALNRYGLPSTHEGYCSGEGGCKIDHVIPIEIGGSNDITNLWPQPYFGEWNAHLKDDLEMFLYKGICNGTINQRHAQKEMRKNWIKAYRKYMVVKGNTTTIATKWHTNDYDGDDDNDDDVEQEKKENEEEEEEEEKKKNKKKKTKKNKKKENKKDKDDDDDEEEDDDDKEEEDDDDDDDGDAHKTKKPKHKDDDDIDEDEDDDDDDDDDFLHHHGSATGNNSNQSANSTSNSSAATPIIDTTGIDKYLTPASDSPAPSVTGESSSSSSSVKAAPDHTLPNKQYTTGAVFPDATPSVVCVSGYTKKVRNVTEAEKKKVYAEYGLPGNNQGFCQGAQGCEIDHLIPLEIGGSNDITNLWPQPYFGDWNAHIKDELENFLKKGICDNTIDQKQAQQDIASNWQTAYNKYIKGQ